MFKDEFVEATRSLSQVTHDRLRELISQTTPGDRLPSEPKLAKQMGISRATLREVMRTFETQGIIHRKQGVGTFVVQPSQVIETGLEVLESLHTLADRIALPVQMGDFKMQHRLPTADEKDVLDLQRGQKVIEIVWVMEAESRPVAYLVDVLPDDVLSLEDVQQEFNGSVLDLLQTRRGHTLATSRTAISAAAASADVARALGIQRRDVLLYFEATLFTSEGRAIDCSHSYYLPGYFRFQVIRRVGPPVNHP